LPKNRLRRSTRNGLADGNAGTSHRRDAGSSPDSERNRARHDIEFGDARICQQLALAQRVVARRIPVLLHGETGVGKEVFAKAAHAGSPYSGGNFVAVNCASLPESLIESELFGYRAGAFPARSAAGRRGKILLAEQGYVIPRRDRR